MPLKMGHSREVVSKNIKELVRGGRDPKQAIAIALSSARKSKKMAMGGMVEGVDQPEDYRDIAELNDDSQSQGIMSPDTFEKHESFAEALRRKASGMPEEMDGMAEGGLVESETSDDEDFPAGNKPEDAFIKEATEEPMSSMPQKKSDHMELSEEQMKAIMDRKKKRRYVQP